MSKLEELHALWDRYQLCADDDPEKLKLAEEFDAAVYEASQKDFNGQLPPNGIKQRVHEMWLARRRR